MECTKTIALAIHSVNPTSLFPCAIKGMNNDCDSYMYGAHYVRCTICRVRTAIKRLDKERDRNPPAFFLAPAFFLIDNQTPAIAIP